jgi:hypothetical protein
MPHTSRKDCGFREVTLSRSDNGGLKRVKLRQESTNTIFWHSRRHGFSASAGGTRSPRSNPRKG